MDVSRCGCLLQPGGKLLQLEMLETRGCRRHLHDLPAHVCGYTNGTGKDWGYIELDQLKFDGRGGKT